MSGCGCQSCLSGAGACGCCEGVETVTPRPIANRPGLSRLTARIGTQGDFLESMQARLSSHRLADGSRPLGALRTRLPADASMALLDAFATAGDVLTFYQERIANEGYLGTATQDRSVRELARLIGYEPGPAVAASTYLAFTLDSPAETVVTIPAGTGAKSVPGPDETAQTFETARHLDARARWNRLGLRVTEPERGDRDALYLAGTDTGLKPGDALLFQYRNCTPEPMRVLEVLPDLTAKRTALRIEPWLTVPPDNGGGSGVTADTIADLRKNAPGGEIAPPIAKALAQLQKAEGEEIQLLASEIAKQVAEARAKIGTLPQQALLDWLGKVEKAVADYAAQSAAAPAASVVGGPKDDDDDTARPSWIEALATPASVPPRSAEKLARATGTSFASGSDAAYRALAAAAPVVGERIGAALAGTRDGAPEQDLRIYALRVRAGLFGRSFPKRTQILSAPTDSGMETHVSSSGTVTTTVPVGEWPIVETNNDTYRYEHENPHVVALDSVQDGIVPGSWMMIDMRGAPPPEGKDKDEWIVARTDALVIAEIAEVEPRMARADYGGSADSTALWLDDGRTWLRFNTEIDNRHNNQAIIDRDFQLIRRTSVYARAELLPLAERPIDEENRFCVHAVRGGPLPWVELDGLYSGLAPGRYLAVRGMRADIAGVEGVPAGEIAMIAELVHGVRSADGEPLPPGAEEAAIGDQVHSFVRFAGPLAYCYRRDSVEILGNVAKATHGETVPETLGSGDAAGSRQRFALKRAPLTYVPAPNAAGVASSLEIFVDDIRWREVPDLLATGPGDRVYVVRNDAGGKASVIFPDGRDGTRPPTGSLNLRAKYRQGSGRSGNLGAGRLEQLASRPLGLRGVINPVPATGGIDPERHEQIRVNAPVSTMALDRLVSVRDHEDFARGFAGIAKAQARAISSGSRGIVHLSVAGEDDAPLEAGGELLTNLRGAFRALGDPDLPVLVAPRELKLLIVAAKIRIDSDRLWEPVVQAVRARLAERFGFDARGLGEGLAPSVLVAAIQAVPGVAWIDLDTFGGVATMEGVAGARLPRTPDVIAEAVRKIEGKVARWVPAMGARAGEGGLLPAELLLLSPVIPDTLILNQIG